ncbi:uncharacterized protein K452DRAFT_128489 [Aplosporella prunicola CBS 121167]|uniref:Uncharacterized protein n=1 Tax=Aplosporella prunicola CBS 121167 TaxID=1176127 RepID=A0A6A6AXS1_9PEZI|nr:uncharacterized protein K452DRAFT_128489 [Aplosporella prunicola CBS 121167]KAF2136570.1 hypothetical protein K452DRAFT_128489 [Aplosporella prunicola CBS 121167]
MRIALCWLLSRAGRARVGYSPTARRRARFARVGRLLGCLPGLYTACVPPASRVGLLVQGLELDFYLGTACRTEVLPTFHSCLLTGSCLSSLPLLPTDLPTIYLLLLHISRRLTHFTYFTNQPISISQAPLVATTTSITNQQQDQPCPPPPPPPPPPPHPRPYAAAQSNSGSLSASATSCRHRSKNDAAGSAATAAGARTTTITITTRRTTPTPRAKGRVRRRRTASIAGFALVFGARRGCLMRLLRR